jgi:predicted nucleic acid-binding protein
MIVVADTSPLNYLVILGAVDVLPKLFTEVHAPPGVMQELQYPRSYCQRCGIANVTKGHEKSPGTIVPGLIRTAG